MRSRVHAWSGLDALDLTLRNRTLIVLELAQVGAGFFGALVDVRGDVTPL